ncbi:TolC family protein [Thiohalobacter thiocyanaticus]|nr:TolC family protein [Thiohalobacter thiocyanaticus]
MSAAPVAAPLSLPEAEALALMHDRQAVAYEAGAQARREQAVAAAQLPDPSLKLGIANLPVESFDRSDTPMSQLQVGVRQRFPPGRTLALAGQREERLAAGLSARAELRRREVLRELRRSYLEVYYQTRAGWILDETYRLFEDLVDTTRAYYGAGRKNQQDVLRAGVELSLLDDRRDRVRTRLETARAELARLVGPEAVQRPLAEEFPEPPALSAPEAMQRALDRHPQLQRASEQIAAGRLGVAVARERYKPGWSLDVTYGERNGREADGSGRSDLLSAMVVVDLPLFTDKRQDRMLAARQYELNAVEYEREELRRELHEQLEAARAEWERLQARLARYRERLLPEASQHAEASLKAYQSGVSDFTALMRARLIELDARLTALRLRTDLAQTAARLRYLVGEES